MKAETISFEVVIPTGMKDAQVQKVEMKDEVPTALLIINKKGEFLDKVSLLDNAKGTVEHMFEYISGNLLQRHNQPSQALAMSSHNRSDWHLSRSDH